MTAPAGRGAPLVASYWTHAALQCDATTATLQLGYPYAIYIISSLCVPAPWQGIVTVVDSYHTVIFSQYESESVLMDIDVIIAAPFNTP